MSGGPLELIALAGRQQRPARRCLMPSRRCARPVDYLGSLRGAQIRAELAPTSHVPLWSSGVHQSGVEFSARDLHRQIAAALAAGNAVLAKPAE